MFSRRRADFDILSLYAVIVHVHDDGHQYHFGCELDVGIHVLQKGAEVVGSWPSELRAVMY